MFFCIKVFLINNVYFLSIYLCVNIKIYIFQNSARWNSQSFKALLTSSCLKIEHKINMVFNHKKNDILKLCFDPNFTKYEIQKFCFSEKPENPGSR